MLNDKELTAILDKVDDIHWKTQDSTATSVLFYKFSDDPKSVQEFANRIAPAKFAWLIVNKSHTNLPKNSSIVADEAWPALQKSILDRLYPLPKLKLIAITGTNGKTTTTDLVLQLGELMGKKGMSLGTLGVRENHKTILDFGLTSPPLIDLRKYLSRYGKGKDFCVMEASSHALVQDRLEGIMFDGAGWLSFTQDHLDFHQTMDDYFQAKMLIFNHLRPGAKLYVPAEQSELLTKISSLKKDQTAAATEILGELPDFFRARFNRNNLEVASSILASVFGTAVPKSWDKLIAPDGRFFIRPVGTNFIVVDSAHTPDALDNICRGIREAFPQHKLKVLFGCGGDRDRTKRPKMATVVESWADKIYLTSDNPRSEDPAQIIDDISKGISKKPYERIVDRPAAVKQAFSELGDKEVLLLAGKGHENYILIKGVKHPYSDIQEVETFVARKSP